MAIPLNLLIFKQIATSRAPRNDIYLLNLTALGCTPFLQSASGCHIWITYFTKPYGATDMNVTTNGIDMAKADFSLSWGIVRLTLA